MAETLVKEIAYGGWANCVFITNSIVELIVTVDVGPRIIRYGFPDQKNEMCEVESTMGLTGGNEWRIYGGHRLWHSPESKPRTYAPDNSPVSWETITNGIKTLQDTEQTTNLKKEMEISLSLYSSEVSIIHRLHNAGPWPVELSVWSISAMATGGKEVIPLTRRNTGLLPNRVISLWPYTRLDDPRVFWGEKYIVLLQDPGIKSPFKIGIANEDGWAAYFNRDHLFVKYYSHNCNARYPDFGVSYETYTNDFMLEMETLSPLTLLDPDASVEHKETWELFDDVPAPRNEESSIEGILSERFNT
jgi:hypothetical protein